MKNEHPTVEAITDAINYLIHKWDKENGLSPYGVNCGNCMDFAAELRDFFPTGEDVWGEDLPKNQKHKQFNVNCTKSTSCVDCSKRFECSVPQGHCFFIIQCLVHGELKELCFDSESPEGVEKASELHYYKRGTWRKKNMALKELEKNLTPST